MTNLDRKTILRGRLMGLLFVLFAVAFVITMFKVSSAVAPSIAKWVRAQGALGVVAWIAIYATALGLMVPVALPAALSGYIFGAGPGIAIAIPSGTVGCLTAFLLARRLLHKPISKRVDAWPRFQAVRLAVGMGGLRIVTLLRLSPVLPHNLMNYALGVTPVRTRDFVLGSVVGMAPLTALQVYAGSLVKNAGEIEQSLNNMTVWHYLGIGVGIVATVFAIMMIIRYARQALAKAVAEAAKKPEEPESSLSQ